MNTAKTMQPAAAATLAVVFQPRSLARAATSTSQMAYTTSFISKLEGWPPDKKETRRSALLSFRGLWPSKLYLRIQRSPKYAKTRPSGGGDLGHLPDEPLFVRPPRSAKSYDQQSLSPANGWLLLRPFSLRAWRPGVSNQNAGHWQRAKVNQGFRGGGSFEGFQIAAIVWKDEGFRV
ncbi:MAG: hypothetical protein JWM16_1621 [Verrucomicrobiales bacterium]|nr:hypothetical protein [Verrucomicrobiales bacterium]